MQFSYDPHPLAKKKILRIDSIEESIHKGALKNERA